MTSTENPQASSCIRISEPHTFKAAHRPQSRLQAAVIGFDRIVNRYERSSVAGLAGRSALGGVLVGIRCDRPGQGRWE
jgi:hypothetical protein